ncbi:1498_t:CDS:1, partial [Cetraspora pellucida]
MALWNDCVNKRKNTKVTNGVTVFLKPSLCKKCIKRSLVLEEKEVVVIAL